MDNILTQVVVPLLAAIIGGGMTLWGVLITLNKERKQEEARKREEYMPFLFSVNEKATVDLDSVIHYTFGLGANSKEIAFVGVQGRIKNVGQKPYVLDRIETPSDTYIPLDGNIVDVGCVCQLYIRAEEELDKEWILYVKDLLGNEYAYELLDVQTQVFRITNVVKIGKRKATNKARRKKKNERN